MSFITSNTPELVTYNTEAIEISDVKLSADGREYDLSEGTKLIMPEDFNKNKAVMITGTITTTDTKFAEGEATVNAFLARGTLEPGSKAPVITPYAAEIRKAADGKYSFRVQVPLTDKPDYQYAYRPATEAVNMNPGNHIITLVATGQPYDQNTWNYNVICQAE